MALRRLRTPGFRNVFRVKIENNLPNGLSHRCPTCLWQRATPVIADWYAGRTWKNDEWYILPPHLLCNFCSIQVYTTYKCGRELHNTTWRVAGLGAATRSQTEMTPHNAITGILHQLNRARRNSCSFFLHVNRGSSWFHSAYSANYLYTKVATKSSFEWSCHDAADEA
jgi:hypothetical protein